MKKEQLREGFARIQPREALIQSTLDMIHAQRASGAVVSTERKWTLGFATRLATAACALLLVVGVGVMFARNGMVPSDAVVTADDERMAPMTVTGDEQDGDATVSESDGVLVGCEAMIEAAKGYGADWAVLAAAVDAVYFKSETEGVATLRPITVADKSVGGASTAWTDEAQDLPVVCFDASDDELRTLMTNMGSVLVGLHTEERGGETVWVIHEAYAEETAAE